MNVLRASLRVLLISVLMASAGMSQDGASGAGDGLLGSGAGAGISASGSYFISPLDYLRIALFVADEVQFQTEVRVSQSGTITVPHLGSVEVAGRSVEEVREDLYTPYDRDYYVDPHIDVVVLSYAERSVTVIGKVNRQGLVPFPSEKGLTLMEAIAAAGGWSADRLSDKSKVSITRAGEDGEKVVIEVDARKISNTDYPLMEGDLINVPERIW